jgi:hypothetical protein
MSSGSTLIYDTGNVYLVYYVTVNGITEWYNNITNYQKRIEELNER